MHQDFSYDEEPKAILASEVKQLRNKQVPLVKILWQHHDRNEATWEARGNNESSISTTI